VHRQISVVGWLGCIFCSNDRFGVPTEDSAQAILSRFDRQVRRAEKLTDEGWALYRRAKLSLGSLDGLFRFSFLSMHSDFEIFLEDLFYSAVTGSSGIENCVPHVTFINRDQANLIFFNDKSYVNWMPYPRGARKISRAAFVSGSPFDRLENQRRENDVLLEFTNLRNAIAHRSQHALKQIEHLTKPMKPRRRHAAGYLQSRSSGMSKFSSYATDIRIIAAALASPNVAQAKQRLSPEEPYGTSEKPGPGKYECATCGISRTLQSPKKKIGICKICLRRNVNQIGWRRTYS
jgi:ribosomal protein S14